MLGHERELFFGALEAFGGGVLYAIVRFAAHRFVTLRPAILLGLALSLPAALLANLAFHMYFWWAPPLGVVIGFVADLARVPAVQK